MTAPSLKAYAQGQSEVSADNLNTFEQTCNTFANLRAFIGTAGQQVFVRGGSTISDGLGGAFYWSPNATAADDGLNVIVPTGASIGRWLRVFVSALSIDYTYPATGAVEQTVTNRLSKNLFVSDFGAVGDGITDDTAAIQAAINAAADEGGGIVHFPLGVYSVTGLVVSTSYVSLQGVRGGGVFNSGSGGSVLKARAGTTTVLTVAPPASETDTMKQCGVSDLAIDGNSIATTSLLIQTVSGCVFRNLAVKGATTRQIETSTVTGSLAGLNYVYSCAFENIWIFAPGSSDGLYISGEPAGVGGNRTVFCSFKHMHVTYVNGTGIKLVDADDNAFYMIGMSRAGGGSGVGVEFVGDDPDPQDLVESNHFFFLWPGPGGVVSRGSKAVRNMIFALGTTDGPIPVTVSNGSHLAYVRDDGVANYAFGVFAKSAAPVSHTGTTAETALATITIPAQTLGPNGIVRITARWTVTNNGNNKTARVRWNGVGGTAMDTSVQTSNFSFWRYVEISNRNSQSSQIGSANGGGGGWAPVGGAWATASINTTSAVNLVLTGELASSGDTITLESYVVEILRGD